MYIHINIVIIRFTHDNAYYMNIHYITKSILAERSQQQDSVSGTPLTNHYEQMLNAFLLRYPAIGLRPLDPLLPYLTNTRQRFTEPLTTAN